MYLYGVYAVALATLLATTWLQITSAAVVGSAKHVAVRYANVALERAQDELLDSLAAQVLAHGPSGPFVAPAPSAAVPACSAQPCAIFVATQVQIAGQTAAGTTGNAVAANVQQQTGVAEGRVAAILTSAVTNAAGGLLARATRRVTLRTFAVAPYVALGGVDDGVAGNASVADFAGSCDGSSCGGTDNRIHALLRCADPVTPANCAGQPYRSADTFSSKGWQNANAASDGWSR
jgi:hypothetical protein